MNVYKNSCVHTKQDCNIIRPYSDLELHLENPFTGKKTMALVPNSQLFPTAFAQYSQFLNENKIVTGTKDSEMITRVGQRIAVAAERWLNANGHQAYLKDYK